MFSRPASRVRYALPFLSISLLLGGCSLLKRQAAKPVPTPIPTPKGPQPPKIDFATVRPNELGLIPVIMYHEVKGTVSNGPKLIRSVESFKQDLEELYKAGFYPVNLGDVVENNIDVPAGKSPVVLTFDDARGSQFQLAETANSLNVAPDCAVGIMEEFHKKHPNDWPLRGTFFVLPKSKATMDPFGQIGLGDQKLQYLVKEGFEIGNHSTFHKSFRPMNPEQIQAELGYANNTILASAPEAKLRVFALPMGKYPSNKTAIPYLMKGTYQGKSYDYKAIMLAAWRPIASPVNTKYNPLKLERIDSVDGVNGIRDWIKKLSSSSSGFARYISDGDPNVVSYPKGLEKEVNLAKIKEEGKLAYAYSPFGGTGGAKPILSAGDSAAPAAGTPGDPTQPTDTTPPGNKKTIQPAATPLPSNTAAAGTIQETAPAGTKPAGG